MVSRRVAEQKLLTAACPGIEVRQHDGHSGLQPMQHGRSRLPPWVGGATEAGMPDHGTDGIRCPDPGPDPALSVTGTVRDARRHGRSVELVDRCLGPAGGGLVFHRTRPMMVSDGVEDGFAGQRLQGCRLSSSHGVPTNGMHLLGLVGIGKVVRVLSTGMSNMLDRQSARYLYIQRRSA